MRLICPNCGAQYEVPDEVIPETGRDVQCSNCGDTWFQHHSDHEPDQETDETRAAKGGWDSPEVDSNPEPVADEQSENEAEPESSEPTAPRRELDPEVTSLLREEAAREESARKSESAGGIETQPDLGLDEQSESPAQHSGQVMSRVARLRGLPDSTESEDASSDDDIDPNSRRNLLPDIEEINSSLTSDAERNDANIADDDIDGLHAPARKKSGFRRGFLMSVTLILLLVLLYMLAPLIAQKVPALEGPLSGFMEIMNGLRAQLSSQLGGFLDWFNAMSSPPSS